MAISKLLHTYIAAATPNAAGATTTGTARNMTTDYGAKVTIKLTNGATGPTVAPQAKVMVSGDNTNWKTEYVFTGDTANGSVNEWVYPLDKNTMYSRVDVTGNTVQPVTCEAFAQVTIGM